MIEVFKITHNIYAPKVSPELRYYPKSNTRGNKYQLLNHTFHYDTRKYSFSARIVNICELLETIIRDSLVEHLDKNGLINASQHRFRKGESCLSNLLTFLDGVTRSLDNHDTVDVIYLDFAKALDKVPHKRLLDKLDKHGIGGKVWVWLKEWLSDRRQRVCVNGCKSAWEAVTSGVPQGSVLGPILFLIYINDIDSNLVSSILKFADDTKLYGKVNNDYDRRAIQRDLDSLLKWPVKWQMPFNSSKCVVMHLGKGNHDLSYFMGNQQLDTVDKEREIWELSSRII